MDWEGYSLEGLLSALLGGSNLWMVFYMPYCDQLDKTIKISVPDLIETLKGFLSGETRDIYGFVAMGSGVQDIASV